jgi:hypothetical protein
VFLSLLRGFVAAALLSVISFAGPNDANAETVCNTSSMGDKNCITANEMNGSFSAKVTWSYKVARNTVVPGKSIKYSEWRANILCSSRYGNITYIIFKDAKNKTITISQDQLNNAHSGLTKNSLPRLISVLCG